MSGPATAQTPLSVRQKQVLTFMRFFLQCNHQLPPCPAMAHAFGWRSPNAAADVLKMLEKKQYLTRNELGHLMLSDQIIVIPRPTP